MGFASSQWLQLPIARGSVLSLMRSAECTRLRGMGLIRQASGGFTPVPGCRRAAKDGAPVVAMVGRKKGDEMNRGYRSGACRSALPDDAPFALAIGASILSTLVLPVGAEQEDSQEDSLLGPDDVRTGAMQIISFIPLFNWLVWVFAWLDTRQSRYLAFVVVYLAPYLKTGLSLSPEDSWLPVASVLACVVHVQLDISVNAEGAESPLGDISKFLREKMQVKDLWSQADVHADRSKELAEKSDALPIETAIQEDDQGQGAARKAIQEEARKNEFADWDEKLSRSKAKQEAVKETDS